MNKRSQAKTPYDFGWRGWLTITPVLALIGFGSWLVVQEHRLARQIALDSLNGAGTALIQHLESNVSLFSWLREPDEILNLSVLERPQDVFIIPLAPDGKCLIPASPHQPPLPTPKSLPWSRLNETLILQWETTHQTTNLNRRLASAESFLAASPPEPFDALMSLTRISALYDQNETALAFSAIEALRKNLPNDAWSEAGVPLNVLLDLQELRLIRQQVAAGNDPHQALSHFGNRQLKQPSPWSRRMLTQPPLTSETSPQCSQVAKGLIRALDRQEEARAIHESVPTIEWKQEPLNRVATPHWIHHRDTPFLVARLTNEASTSSFLAVREVAVSRDFQQSITNVNQRTEFEFSVSIDGRPIWATGKSPASEPDSNQADAVSAIQQSATLPWLQTRVHLSNPNVFFAQSRQKTRSLLILMILASVTGLIGWSAQRAAFRRQVALGQMKSNFVASVSHELRAPIASIRLMSENLQSPATEKSDQQKHYLKWIALECRRLSSLVDNVLQFARHESGRSTLTLEPVDVRKLFNETVQLMEPLAANADVRIHSTPPTCDPTNLTIWPDGIWDGQAVHQALVNLIDNAIKHTPRSGIVTTQLEVSCPKKLARLIVIDQGPGIPAADRERIFSPFERLGSEETRRNKGVGIGLNLVRQTAEAHGGSIIVEDADPNGSRFILTLPLEPDQK